jgi:assimilatory nitrate reductase catalytic subunit
VVLPLRGFSRTHRAIALPEGTWWARVAVSDGIEYRLATGQGPMVWHDFAYRALAGDARLAEQLDRGVYRAAAFVDGELDACLCVGPADAPLTWDAAGLQGADAADGEPLTARISNDQIGATAPVICACFGVAVDTVRQAVAAGTARNVADIGQTLRAGTNCGSCVPELKRLVGSLAASFPAAAE